MLSLSFCKACTGPATGLFPLSAGRIGNNGTNGNGTARAVSVRSLRIHDATSRDLRQSFFTKARMEREELLAKLVNEIAVRKAPDRPLLVRIDGRCASGKTALAGELAGALARQNPCLEVLRPSVDGFHNTRERRYRQGEYSATGYYQDAYDASRGQRVEMIFEDCWCGTA